jgi:hypothetical protein
VHEIRLQSGLAAFELALLIGIAAPNALAEGLKAPTYTAPEGWRIALVGFVNQERARKIAEGMEILQQGGDWPDAGKLVKLEAREGGEWVGCEVLEFADCRLEIWKDTRMIITLKSGREVKSLAIVATADKMQTMLLDNRVTPFLVTDKAVYGRRGPPQLHVKLDAAVKPEDVESIRFEGIVAKCD